jgi:hypothetical protein
MSKNGYRKKIPSNLAANLPEKFRFPKTEIERKLFVEYGALFVARGGAAAPERLIFKNEREVLRFQKSVSIMCENIGGFALELQTAAMENLKLAIAEAEKNDLTITPRGADAARRSYKDTIDLWASRVNPALNYWMGEGKLSDEEAEKIRRLAPFEQVAEVFRLEDEDIFFSKDLQKPIMFSVAPPGASQHLSMLAFDVSEFNDARVRGILARHFWFQTVVSDLPHFTFLGAAENELDGLGLKRIETDDGRVFWTPDI